MHSRLLMILSLLLCISVKGQSNNLQLEDLVNAALEHNQHLKSVDYEIEKDEIIRKQIYHTYIPTLEAGGMFAYTAGTLDMNTDAIGIPTQEILAGLDPALTGLLFPHLTADHWAAIGSQLPTEVPAIDHSMDFNSQLYQVGLTAKWTLFTGLKVPMLGKAMDHKIKATEIMKAQSEAEVISQVIYYYDKIAVLKQSETLIKENQARLDRETMIAKRALEEGLITEHEFQKIEIAKLELQSKIVEYNGSQMVLFLKLKQLTAINTIELEKMDVTLQPMLRPEDGMTHMNRPEVLALEEAIIASEYKAKAELSGYLPKVQAFASHQYMGATNGELGSVSFDGVKASPLNMVGIGFKWELFDGLHTHAEHQKAMIDIDQQVNRKEEAIELLELNFENCQSKYYTAIAKVDLKEKKKDLAKQSLEISYKELQNGLIELSDFLESQTVYEKAVLGYFDTLFEQRQATVELLKATGSLQAYSL